MSNPDLSIDRLNDSVTDVQHRMRLLEECLSPQLRSGISLPRRATSKAGKSEITNLSLEWSVFDDHGTVHRPVGTDGTPVTFFSYGLDGVRIVNISHPTGAGSRVDNGEDIISFLEPKVASQFTDQKSGDYRTDHWPRPDVKAVYVLGYYTRDWWGFIVVDPTHAHRQWGGRMVWWYDMDGTWGGWDNRWETVRHDTPYDWDVRYKFHEVDQRGLHHGIRIW